MSIKVYDIKKDLTLSPPWDKQDFVCPKNTQNYWNKLSNELILTIFNWICKKDLCKISLTCQRFYAICHAEILWPCLDISNKKISEISFSHLLRLGIKTLRAYQIEILCDSTEEIKYKRNDENGKLIHADFSFSRIPNSLLNSVFATNRMITHLSLEDYVIDGDISALAQLSNLEIVNFARCSGFSGQLLVQLFAKNSLIELNLAWTNLSEPDLKLVCQNLPKTLKRLNMSGYRDHLLDSDVSCIVSCSPLVEELDLSDCNQLTNACITTISKQLPNLTALALSRCYKIDPNKLLELTGLKKFTSLDIFNLVNELGECQLKQLFQQHGLHVEVNKNPFSTIARPTVGIKRTSVWNKRTRDLVVA